MNKISDELLNYFRPSERMVILQRLETTPLEKFNTIPEDEWRKYRNCGDGFIARLIQKGMIGELKVIRKRLTEVEKIAKFQSSRAFVLRANIAASRERIKQWKLELRNLGSK